MTKHPVKPKHRANRIGLLAYLRAFRRDILSAQPARLYHAWMAEFKTPLFRSVLINQPDLIKLVLKQRPKDFPKSDSIGEGLRPLLGESVYLKNGELWERQRRIIDPAFEGGRLRDVYPHMQAAADAMMGRLTMGRHEVEEIASYAAADIIFRTLFSMPIEASAAQDVFHEFRRYQRAQPLLNLGAFIPLPKWMPRFHKRDTLQSAHRIRALIGAMTQARANEIEADKAPDDLATKIMTTVDPETGDRFSWDEMVDQVAIFFLAGHETSASALAWALYLVAAFPEWQDKIAAEAKALDGGFAGVAKLKATRSVFRETLRLYPPVPMMVRETVQCERFRDRDIPAKTSVVISPWHVQRQDRLWDNPDGFDPHRWESENGKACARYAFIPFSAGPRVCLGAGFAMIEGVMLLAHILRKYRVMLHDADTPVPVAHLTVRAKNGIFSQFDYRD